MKNTITSKLTLVLFTHVFSRNHYVFIFCGRSLDSVISRSSNLHQSKVYVSSGLFEIVIQTNHISLWTLKGCSETYHDRTFESKSIKEALPLKKH